MSPENFVRFIGARRFTLSDETLLQQEIAAELILAGVPFDREVRLSAKERVDFMLPGGVAVEVKIKGQRRGRSPPPNSPRARDRSPVRSEEHTSELQSLMRISYAVFC